MASNLQRRTDALRRATPSELERLYAAPSTLAIPSGRYEGCFLQRTAGWGHAGLLVRSAVALGFSTLPFGIDFDRRVWRLAGGAVVAGRFELQPAPSRWRPTRTLAMHYEPSRLPTFVRALLYDEVKPIDEDLLLGLGCIAQSDLFFFALGAEPACSRPAGGA
jgi:hypothetical protein